MYEELVKRLRETTFNHEEKCDSCPYEEDYPCCVDCLDEMHKAADAIEELVAIVLTDTELLKQLQKGGNTNCTYCHEDRDGFVTPVEKNGHAVIWNYGGDKWMLCLKAKGWRAEAPINFCPMCGRKLRESKEK